MANPSHDKGNVAAAVIAWWEENRPLGWAEEDHVAQATVNCETDAEQALARLAAQLVRATPPSPSTAPEVDVRHEFEMYKSNLGEAANYIGDGQYGNHGVTAQADAFRAGVEVGRRAALASRPAEVDDEGLPEVLFDGNAVYAEITRKLGKAHCHNHETVSATLNAVVRLMRQGQRDAVAADRARRGGQL